MASKKMFEAFGELRTAYGWATDPRCAVTYRAFRDRLARGWEVERALTEPPSTSGSPKGNRGNEVLAFGESKSISAWSRDERCQVGRKGLERRLREGWEPEKAIAAPHQSPSQPGQGAGIPSSNKGTSSYPELLDGEFVSGFKTIPELMVGLGCSWGAAKRAFDRFNLEPEPGRVPVKASQVSLLMGEAPSKGEFFEFIESLGLEVERSARSLIPPFEIDAYVPSRSIAVNFNELYWNSEKFNPRDYHYKVWAACHEVEVQLIQIWEDDWQFRRPAVESLLKHKLGLSDSDRIYARNTEVVQVTDTATQRTFYDQNHVQGFVSGSYIYALEYNGDIVAMCTFRNEGGMWNLSRYATSCVVVGGFTKLLAAFRRDHEGPIKTFADLSVSDGGLYESNGWTQDKILPPDYSYLVGVRREHKFNYRVDRFRTDPDLKFEEGLSETELANLNGLHRIWDTGKVRYLMF